MNDGHKVEGCRGRWIDVGTLRDPFKQVCNACRASRQKPADEGEPDVSALNAAEQRHMRGLRRLKEDLENHDPVHQDEAGFWFWDETWTGRHGPYETEQVCREALDEYAESLVIEPEDRHRWLRWIIVIVALSSAFAAGWLARGL